MSDPIDFVHATLQSLHESGMKLRTPRAALERLAQTRGAEKTLATRPPPSSRAKLIAEDSPLALTKPIAQPAVAAALAWLILRESLGPWELLAMACVVVASAGAVRSASRVDRHLDTSAARPTRRSIRRRSTLPE